MQMPNARQDVLFIILVREAFSSPSFELFSSFIVGFIQLGREGRTTSMVQSLSRSLLSRSLSSFTRFPGKNCWTMDEVLATALHEFFRTLKIQDRSVLFFLLDDTIIKKTGKEIPGCAWCKGYAQNLGNVFGHQSVLAALLYKQSVLPLGASLYHPKGVEGCGRFH